MLPGWGNSDEHVEGADLLDIPWLAVEQQKLRTAVVRLTRLNPIIMEDQKATLLSVFFPRTSLVRCSMTMGSCSIWQTKP